MGREVRKVHKDWVHPKYSNGNYIALYEGFAESLKEWEEGNKNWVLGLRDDFNGGLKQLSEDEKNMSYSDWAGRMPSEDDYMPDWPESEATHYMMYETTSEGTPISPAFETPEALARWLVDNNASAFADQTASYEGWLRVARGGFACSAVLNVGSGAGLVSGVDAL